MSPLSSPTAPTPRTRPERWTGQYAYAPLLGLSSPSHSWHTALCTLQHKSSEFRSPPSASSNCLDQHRQVQETALRRESPGRAPPHPGTFSRRTALTPPGQSQLRPCISGQLCSGGREHRGSCTSSSHTSGGPVTSRTQSTVLKQWCANPTSFS